MSNDADDIRFCCPECKQSLAAANEMAGAQIKCPSCSHSLCIPATSLNPTETPTKSSLPDTDPQIQRGNGEANREHVEPEEELGDGPLGSARDSKSKDRKRAVASIILGVIGFVILGYLLAVPSIILGHMSRKGEKKRSDESTKRLSTVGLIVGYWALVISVATGFSLGLVSGGGGNKVYVNEVNVREYIQGLYNSREDGRYLSQGLFDAIHPVGDVTSATVHEVKILWKNDKQTGQIEDVLSYEIRMTIYWSAIWVTDGFTKLSTTFDLESGRYTNLRVIATNGQTKEEFTENAFIAASWLIGAMLTE